MLSVVHVQETFCVCLHMHLSQKVFLSLSWVLFAVKRECLHHLSVSKSELIVMVLLGYNDEYR